MRQLNIALCLIEQAGKYLMQLRNGDPKIGGAGLIGCFGGKIEDGESSVQAASREVGEETNHKAGHDQLSYLGEVNVFSDHNLEPVQVRAHVHRLVVDATAKIEAVEGKLVRMTIDEVKENLGKLTTGTRACFEKLVFEETE
ncbi:MAG: NUDIX domain-containing protein [Acidobacteriota bacterium]